MLRGRRLTVSPCQLPRCGIGFGQAAALTAAAARPLSYNASLPPKSGPPDPPRPSPKSNGPGHSAFSRQFEEDLRAWEAERQQQIRMSLNTPASRPENIPGNAASIYENGSAVDPMADQYFPDVDSTIRETEQETEYSTLRYGRVSRSQPFPTSGGDMWSQQQPSLQNHDLFGEYDATRPRTYTKRPGEIRHQAFYAARDRELKALKPRDDIPLDSYLSRLVAMGHQPFRAPPSKARQPRPNSQLQVSLEKESRKFAYQEQEEDAPVILQEPDPEALRQIAERSAMAVGLAGVQHVPVDDNPSHINFNVDPTWMPFQKLSWAPFQRMKKVKQERARAKERAEGQKHAEGQDRVKGLERAKGQEHAEGQKHAEGQERSKDQGRAKGQERAEVQERAKGRKRAPAEPTFRPAALSEADLYRPTTDLSYLDAAEPASMLNMDQGVSHMSSRGVTFEETPAAVHSIFSMLFPEGPEQHISRSSLLTRSPYGPSRQSTPIQASEDMDPRKKHFVDVPATLPAAPGSIYNQLFPESALPNAEAKTSDEGVAQELPQDEDDDTLFISLRNEVRNWLPKEDKQILTAPQPGEYGSQSTVVVISGLSNTLVDSDFYRIIPEGRHVEGWAGGLVKCVQARDSLTYEPLGQYFLMFHSRPAAEAFVKEVQRLHHLSRRLLSRNKTLSASTASSSTSSPDSPSAPPPLTDDELAAVQSFTLFPPRITPKIQIHMWGTKLIAQLATRTNIADVVQALKPEAETPARVLLLLNNGAASPAQGLTVAELWLTLRDDGRERGVPWALLNLKEGIRPVRLGFSKTKRAKKVTFQKKAVDVAFAEREDVFDETEMTGRTLHRLSPQHDAALYAETTKKFENVSALGQGEELYGEQEEADESASAADTAAAVNGKMGNGNGNGNGKPKANTKDRYNKASKTSAVSPDERFNRYILTFKQRAIARRFVRLWHKRPIWDPETRRAVVVDAVALM